MKYYFFLVFLIIFIIPISILFPSKIEHFSPKITEKNFILTKSSNSFSFQFNSQSISITPSNKSFIFNKPLSFSQINNQLFLISSKKINFNINLRFSQNPITIVINKHEDSFEFKKANTGHSQNLIIYNIINFDKTIGNIKIFHNNNQIDKIILKTNYKDIYDNFYYIIAIFTSFLLFEQLIALENIDYDSKFLSK